MVVFFFFNDTATTEIYTLSLHDALPILALRRLLLLGVPRLPVLAYSEIAKCTLNIETVGVVRDRKSTRLNSSHLVISYAVFCLKKKNKQLTNTYRVHAQSCVGIV